MVNLVFFIINPKTTELKNFGKMYGLKLLKIVCLQMLSLGSER